MTNDYDMAKAQADAAFVSDVARWLEGQHDYAEQKDQPWFARAAEMLRSLEPLTEGEEIERRARSSFERRATPWGGGNQNGGSCLSRPDAITGLQF